ncbi:MULTISPECIES: MFS transporter [unclassified Haladaptatus]|uniref:MFS transporter n=1 Tax=unclassified Haladaptatus TaxID=2622732 RepID=UPI0023E7E6D6|nr:MULTISPECIES: MFS transporter [unclassified Haladaptatus]
MNRNDKSIVGLVMVAHAMVHTYELSIPILLLIWMAEFGVNEATISLVVSAGFALFGIGALPSGVLVDRFGSGPLITACLLGMGGSFLLLGLAPNLLVVAAALLLWGVAASVYHPSGLALISRGVTERGSAFAYHGVAGNLGIALGPLVTSLLLLAYDWRIVVGLLAIPAGLAALYAGRVKVDEQAAVTADGGEETDSEPISSVSEFVSESRALFVGGFALVLTVAMMSGLYYRGALTFLPALITEFLGFDGTTVQLAGFSFDIARDELSRYVYSGLLMVGVMGQYAGGKLTDRVPVEYGIMAGFGTLSVIALVIVPAAAIGVIPFLLVGVALGFTLFMVQPIYQASIAEYTPAAARGLSYGYTYFFVFGVGAAGGVIAGTLLTYFSPMVLFTVLACFGATGSLIGFVLSRRAQRAQVA